MSRAVADIDARDLQRQIRKATRKLERLRAQDVPRMTARALNRTADKTRTGTRRQLSAVKSVPAKVLKRRIQSYKASARHLVARVWVGLKTAITPAELGGGTFFIKGKRAGTLKVGRKTFTGVFPATMPSGHQGLFVRKGRKRLPIEEPRVRLSPEAQPIVLAEARARMRDDFPRELRRLLDLRIKQLRRRG